VFLTVTSVGYGDGVSMPIGLTNPADYISAPLENLDYDKITTNFGSDRFKLTLIIMISYITFYYFLSRIPANLDSLIKEDAVTPDTVEDELMAGIEYFYLDHN